MNAGTGGRSLRRGGCSAGAGPIVEGWCPLAADGTANIKPHLG